MADAIYNKFRAELLNGNIDLVNDTIKVMLLKNSYTPDVDAHDFIDDVSGDEVSGTGYTAGGATLANPAVTEDDANDKGKFDADDVSWPNSTITAHYAVVYKDTGTPSSSPVLGVFDFGADKTTNNTEFKITWGANGIFRA